MSRLDLVIFGATGFTGKHAAIEMARQRSKFPDLTWGIAGRSQAKLADVLKEVAKKTDEDVSSVKIILADVNDEKSLRVMCSQARVVVNCCGPYRHYGEPVVKAAIDCKTHHVDVSGEPEFIETMQLLYDQQARDAGVFIISACGFESIPTDLGTIFLEQKFNGTLNSVETYLTSKMKGSADGGVINYGTWESLVYGVTNYNKLPALRKKVYPERLPEFKPKLQPRPPIHRRLGGWCVPFPGADRSVVYHTQRHLLASTGKRPVQLKTYVRLESFMAALGLVFGAVMLFIMTRIGFMRDWLLKYPSQFSLGFITRDGPSEEVMNNSSFEVVLLGEGWAEGADLNTKPNKRLAAKVSGVNPGYGATVVALLYSAITLLRQRDRMPAQGGVVTTGVAFRNTDIIERLHDNHLHFEIIDDENLH
ncbi:unnamed protein product [Leptidea sinapis]|uniref:Saccharopine dehydrogenase NADP binding domain-containing protein n=1 Tax=Leptidea sinapis TaxID=189913 RepID=A0A5E4R017_9NEOP|nr:unnamed protein product [Leptidea sinapis]